MAYHYNGSTFDLLPSPSPLPTDGYGMTFAYSPDGKFLVAMCSNTSPYYWIYSVSFGESGNVCSLQPVWIL